jgi:hypothetical protein
LGTVHIGTEVFGLLAFLQTGGIGDAILGTGPIKRLVNLYGPISMAYWERLIPQVTYGIEGIYFNYRIKGSSTIDDMRSLLPNVSMVVSNKFLSDHRGRPNFFIPLDESMWEFCDFKYETYCRNFERDFGMPFLPERGMSIETIGKMSSESNYFSDWNRFEFEVGYDDVFVEIFDYVKDKNEGSVSGLGEYIIVHDSRLERGGTYVKAWEYEKWREVCERLLSMGMKIVQIISPRQDRFHECVIPHYEIIGDGAMFHDYLYLLSRSNLYIGTDSWPGHAAIFTRKPKYVLIKGGVSRRWDHEGRYSEIIRKGKCQACEGPAFAAHSCTWGRTEKECMSLITPDDVMGRVESVLG